MNVFSVVGWQSKAGHVVVRVEDVPGGGRIDRELAARVARARLVLEADAALEAPVRKSL